MKPVFGILEKKSSSMIKVLLDVTYAVKGQSGIPTDSRNMAISILKNREIKTDLIIFDSSKYKLNLLGNASKFKYYEILKKISQRIPSKYQPMKRLTYELSLLVVNIMRSRKNKIDLILSERSIIEIFPDLDLIFNNHNFYKSSYTHEQRISRPKFFRSIKIRTNTYNFYIQNHVDAIEISPETKHVVRLHDVLPITHPELFSFISRKFFSRNFRKLSKKDNIYWIVNSGHTANELRKLLPSTKFIQVINCVIKYEPSKIEISKKKNQFIMINTIEPRKNIRFAIETFRIAKESKIVGDDAVLVICGNKGWKEEKLYTDLANSIFGPDVKFYEGLNDLEIKNILFESKYLLSTSIAEGFSMPPLEGMSQGCLPIVSDISAHRELVGTYGFFFANNSDALLMAFEKAIKFCDESDYLTRIIEMQHYVSSNFSADKIEENWHDFFRRQLEVEP